LFVPQDPLILAQSTAWKPPNDLCQSPTGDIYFTSPDFDTNSVGRVYRIAPGGAVTAVITDLPVPNGIITSLDGRTLYVSDSYLRLWKSYPILADGSVWPGAVFFNPGTADLREPDGMTIDEFGNLFFCGRGGVWMVSPAGQLLGMVPFAEFCSNVTFGGLDGHTLYITCDQKLYALDMQVRGAAWRGKPDPNQPPRVNAGPDRVIATDGKSMIVSGQVTDDGLPGPPATLTSKWSFVSGPSVPVIASPGATRTRITFSQLGTYRLRLWAFDGGRCASDEVTIVVAKPADFDGDNDVDINDASLFAGCLSDTGRAPSFGCESMDLDADSDVDTSDFGLVQRCLSGDFVPSDETCTR
jgi:hypothetical protein